MNVVEDVEEFSSMEIFLGAPNTHLRKIQRKLQKIQNGSAAEIDIVSNTILPVYKLWEQIFSATGTWIWVYFIEYPNNALYVFCWMYLNSSYK